MSDNKEREAFRKFMVEKYGWPDDDECYETGKDGKFLNPEDEDTFVMFRDARAALSTEAQDVGEWVNLDADLIARCKEVRKWQKSGVLVENSKLQAYAEKHYHGLENNLLNAEADTAAQAMQAIIDLSAAPAPSPCTPEEAAGMEKQLWGIGAKHSDYGTVLMMGVTGGEAYRWFVDKEGCVSMIPLSMLQGAMAATRAAAMIKEK